MYNFIFYVMYNYQMDKKSGGGYSRFNASLITALIVFMQLLLIEGVIEKYFTSGVKILFKNKIVTIALLGLMVILISKYYSSVKIQANAGKEKYTPTSIRKLIVFFAVVIFIILNIYI